MVSIHFMWESKNKRKQKNYKNVNITYLSINNRFLLTLQWGAQCMFLKIIFWLDLLIFLKAFVLTSLNWRRGIWMLAFKMLLIFLVTFSQIIRFLYRNAFISRLLVLVLILLVNPFLLLVTTKCFRAHLFILFVFEYDILSKPKWDCAHLIS